MTPLKIKRKKLTNTPWKLMVGSDDSFPFKMPRCLQAASLNCVRIWSDEDISPEWRFLFSGHSLFFSVGKCSCFLLKKKESCGLIVNINLLYRNLALSYKVEPSLALSHSSKLWIVSLISTRKTHENYAKHDEFFQPFQKNVHLFSTKTLRSCYRAIQDKSLTWMFQLFWVGFPY